jgi:phospholipid/cholesterol/gamma-HCH transport system substrate-binding protein
MRRSNDVLVGSVVLATIVLVVAAALWVGQAHIGKRRDVLQARFRDVGNIQVGQPVVIRGVRAGRIVAIELADSGWVHVRLALDPSADLPADPVVILNEASMFGEWQATIVDRSGIPENRSLRQQIAEAGGQRGVLPGGTLPDIAQLTAVAGRIAGDVANVAERFQVAFDEPAARELRESIRNFAALTGTLSQTVQAQSGNLNALSADLHEGVTALTATAVALQRTAGRVDSATGNAQLQQVVSDVALASGDIRQAAEELHTVTRRLTRSNEDFDRVLLRSDTALARLTSGSGSLGLLLTDPTLYHHTDSLVVQLRSLAEDIRRRPQRYVNIRVF